MTEAVGEATGPRVVELHTRDQVVIKALRNLAGQAGFELKDSRDPGDSAPSVLVVDIDQPGALDDIILLRREFPDALIVGHLGLPDRARWEEAERSGCDLVANRGAVGRQLRTRLESGQLFSGRRRYPICDLADVAGRLGAVRTVPDSPFGPITLWQQQGGRLSCLGDLCPHAAVSLSEGEVSGGVVTCPGHGSQFDLASGERLRGPADVGIDRFDVVVEDGRVWILHA